MTRLNLTLRHFQPHRSWEMVPDVWSSVWRLVGEKSRKVVCGEIMNKYACTPQDFVLLTVLTYQMFLDRVGDEVRKPEDMM